MNRQIAPEITPIKQIRTGFPESKDNLYRIPSEEGVFKLEIIYPGAGYGLVESKFAAIYGMDLLLSGTKEQTATQISESLDALGAYVFKSCDYYSSSITIYGLNEHFTNSLNIVRNSMENCIYPKLELDIYKSRKISELNINLNKTSFLANRAINDLIFGPEHPFSAKSDHALIASIKEEDLLNFKQDYLKSPYFIFTGSKELEIEKTLEGLGLSKELNKEEIKIEANPEGAENYIFSEKKGATQNSLRMGKVLPSRKDPDYFTISIFNLILGGYFGSRLMKNIREDKGLTYGIHSSIMPFKNYSVFKISSECNSTLTNQVKEEIEKEIKRLQTELVDIEELSTAKNYLIGSMIRNFDGAFNISERFKSFLELETAPRFYEEYFDAINKIGPELIKDCANNYFDIKTLKYSVSGEI